MNGEASNPAGSRDEIPSSVYSGASQERWAAVRAILKDRGRFPKLGQLLDKLNESIAEATQRRDLAQFVDGRDRAVTGADADEWHREHERDLDEVHTLVPRVHLICPLCDTRIVKIYIRCSGPDGEIYLHSASDVRSNAARAASPLMDSHGGGGDGVWLGQERTRLPCPNSNARCKYSGVYLGEELLKLYAIAVELGQREIVLPT